MKLFQYALLWHPTKKELEEGLKSKVVMEIQTILAQDIQKASMMAAMEIPAEYKASLDQIEVAIRPF
jgi:hypothetical protein